MHPLNQDYNMANTNNVITTWKNKSQKPQEQAFSIKCHSNRDRINHPNHLPYVAAHSDFYKLPYETREELRHERRATEKKGVLPVIAEDNDPSELLTRARRFSSFHEDSPETIAKEDIEGKHFRRTTSYRNSEMNSFFENSEPQKPIKRSSSFTELLNEQNNVSQETRRGRSDTL